jgi:ParB family transcriptional regulator, chromosome partitioning protein
MSADTDTTAANPPSDQPQDKTSERLASDQQPAPGPAPWIVPVSLLTAHPGNVRHELGLTPEFCVSVAEFGVRIPLLVAPDGPAYRVIEGHRRLAAAVKAGLDAVPCTLDASREGDDAGQFLDMAVVNSPEHRRNFTAQQEADALFAAAEAGATRTRIRKATGLKPTAVKSALAAATLSVEARSAVGEAEVQLSLEQLAVIAEFQDDPVAVAQLTQAAWDDEFDHAAERLRQQRIEQAEHEQLRAELEGAGYTVTDGFPHGAIILSALLHDGEELTAEAHAMCPGRGVYFHHWALTRPQHYCTNAEANGHAFRYGNPAADPAAVPGQGGSPEPGGSAEARPDPARRLVIEGNRAWKAAAEVRRRWLAGSLLGRRTAPREVVQFTARQLLAMPEPLWSGLAQASRRELFTQLTGQPAGKMSEGCDTATAGRLALLSLAPIITAYEYAMSEGEGRNTWRSDGRHSPCLLGAASAYLALLASLGYRLSRIEQALVDDIPYAGEIPPDELEAVSDDPPQAAGQDSGDSQAGDDSADAADETDTTCCSGPEGAATDPMVPGDDPEDDQPNLTQSTGEDTGAGGNAGDPTQTGQAAA